MLTDGHKKLDAKSTQDARNRTLAVHELVDPPNLGARQAEGIQPVSQPRAIGVRPEFLRILTSFFPIISQIF